MVVEVRELSADPVEHAYREHGEKLWRSLVLFSGDPDIASNAVAEAFAQAIEAGPRIRSIDRWVWRTAFILARAMFQERGRTVAGLPTGSYSVSEASMELALALPRLSPKQRTAVVLYYFADLPVAEVARTMGSTAAACRCSPPQSQNPAPDAFGDR
jgi:RNA polymerase sigma-70 factor (ECF subfamily)